MVEYLRNYNKLIKLQQKNEKEITEKKLIIDSNCQKWIEEKGKEENINKELQKLNKEYNDITEGKEKNLLDLITVVLTILSIAGVFIALINNPIFIILGPVMATMLSGIIYLISFIIIKHTSILEKQFQKDENLNNLLELINNKEKELTNTKELIEKYSQTIIKHRAELKKMISKREYINESINELMRKYATPIFEEQLKNEKTPENKEQKTRTKKKNQ